MGLRQREPGVLAQQGAFESFRQCLEELANPGVDLACQWSPVVPCLAGAMHLIGRASPGFLGVAEAIMAVHPCEARSGVEAHRNGPETPADLVPCCASQCVKYKNQLPN